MNDSKTVVEDLAAWLTKIWDEEEAAAQVEQIPIPPSRNPDGSWMTVPGAPKPGDAHVLARIAADRKILALHRGPHECRVFKTGTHPANWMGEGAPPGEWVYVTTEYFDDDPCPTKLLLASPYADRPGFRPEWSVERQGWSSDRRAG